MDLTRTEELDLSRQFGFYVVDREDRFEAASYFHFRRQDNWGMFFILLLALFPIQQMIYSDDLGVRVMCGVLGLGIGGFAIFGLFTQATDNLVVTSDSIIFRNSLVRRSVRVEQDMKIQMRTNKLVVRGRYPYLLIELWLVTPTREHRIFNFGSHERDRIQLERLGKQMRATISRHIQ